MRIVIFASLSVLALGACRADETVAAYGAAERTWVLGSIDGVPYEDRATFNFGENGEVFGQAPCNRWFARQTAPYPWFAIEAVGATKMACSALDAEQSFFSALQDMTLSEVSGDFLVLSNDAERQMVFTAE
ncbi:MAG: META domain-containing protein [Marinovum sp.]|nr:META domain-containing protein [Marinovum sp.]